VARALDLALTPPDTASAARPPANAAAYDAYVQGEALLQRSEATDYRDDLPAEMLERAVNLDPGYAVAWARLSFADLHVYWRTKSDADRARGAAAAERARTLGPDLPETHLALAYLRYWGHKDYPGARRELDLALRTRPNDPRMLLPSALVARREGRWDDAIETFQRVVSLDPHNPVGIEELAATTMMAHGPAGTEPIYERVAALSPDFFQVWWGWLVVRVIGDDDDRIRDMIHRAERALGDQFPAFVMGIPDHTGLKGILGPLLDPPALARLLTAPIPGPQLSDSALGFETKSALAQATGDAKGSRRFADAAWPLYSCLARLDSTEIQWQQGLARVALLRGRPEEAVEAAGAR
jgi:tetratricopeptide (TPR) repeat protein